MAPQILKTDIFFDSHKHGAKVVSVYVRNAAGTVVDRKTLGAIKRFNDWQTESIGFRFMTNDWTAPEFIDGVRNTSKVAYHNTRKEAMARLLSLA